MIIFEKLQLSATGLNVYIFQDDHYYFCQIVGTELRILYRTKNIKRDLTIHHILPSSTKTPLTTANVITKPIKGFKDIYNRDFIYVNETLKSLSSSVILNIELTINSISGNLLPSTQNYNYTS